MDGQEIIGGPDPLPKMEVEVEQPAQERRDKMENLSYGPEISGRHDLRWS